MDFNSIALATNKHEIMTKAKIADLAILIMEVYVQR
jgi:hypothetical protein